MGQLCPIYINLLNHNYKMANYAFKGHTNDLTHLTRINYVNYLWSIWQYYLNSTLLAPKLLPQIVIMLISGQINELSIPISTLSSGYELTVIVGIVDLIVVRLHGDNAGERRRIVLPFGAKLLLEEERGRCCVGRVGHVGENDPSEHVGDRSA